VSDIFREIDEELRRDNLGKLWTRYGKYVIVLALAAVLATAGVMGWREYRSRQRQADGARYAAALALEQQGKNAEAADAFAELARNANGGHAVLARLSEAALRVKSGDTAGAVAIYDQLASDGGIDPVFRDAATLLSARYGMDKGDSQTIVARLAPLTDAANAWHPLALELTALAELKAGEKAKARDAYQHLADDLNAPQGLRARATEMIAALAP
jgi:hypothetical protein